MSVAGGGHRSTNQVAGNDAYMLPPYEGQEQAFWAAQPHGGTMFQEPEAMYYPQ